MKITLDKLLIIIFMLSGFLLVTYFFIESLIFIWK